ncbi:hypothetical protein KJ633_00455 [bacterium]|nr:hypothetical protein [bacterium]MBU3954912.1 hypothetical protein [bacterium]
MKLQEIKLSVLFLKEGNKFVAYSPALDISTCGKTFDKTKKRFEELVGIFFEELREKGTLEDVLLECGWRKVSKPRARWIPPFFIAQTDETFKIPCRV